MSDKGSNISSPRKSPESHPDKLAGQYALLLQGPALVDRSARRFLEVTGSDRALWLHNLLTNQVKPLEPGQGNYAFALNVQGRILFDLNVLVDRDSILLDLDQGFVETALRHFAKYTITEQVTVTRQDWGSIGLSGARAVDLLTEFGAANAGIMPLLGHVTFQAIGFERSLRLVRSDFAGPKGWEVLSPAALIEPIRQWLCDPARSHGTRAVTDEAVEMRRIEEGIPRSGYEISAEYLPAETGQLQRAVSFNKGCYLGQEVVERMRSRAVVARRLVGLALEGDELPPRGAAIVDREGKSLGVVTSECHSIGRNRVVALGYVKTAAAEPGTALRIAWNEGGAAAVVAELPLAREG